MPLGSGSRPAWLHALRFSCGPTELSLELNSQAVIQGLCMSLNVCQSDFLGCVTWAQCSGLGGRGRFR